MRSLWAKRVPAAADPECLDTGRRSDRVSHPALAVRQTPDTGRSSDSQARPAACLLAARETPQWLETAGLARLVTAAGPSRNRTGVPCLPVENSVFERGHQSRGRLYRLRRGCQSHGHRPWHRQGLPRGARRVANLAGRGRPGREGLTVVRCRAARPANTAPTALSTQRAAANPRGKNTWDSLKPLSPGRR